MKDTDCRKCKATMPAVANAPISSGPFAGAKFTVTGYRCKACGHWNNLKRRKARAAA